MTGKLIRMRNRNWKRVLMPVLAAVFVLLAFCWYVNDYYHSDEMVQNYLQKETPIKAKEIRDGIYLDGPGEERAMIFYPGAKVEYTAYLPLLYELAEQGLDCFLIKMPCNLAFLGQNKATDIMKEYPYKSWYLSGHSLGGAMAAAYSAKHLQELDGLALLAAYPTKSLQSDTFSVVSIYGSEDGVLNRNKVEDGRSFMPSDYTEVCIEGGNHAWFGNYGEQKGDKTAAISREEQQKQTVEAILQMVNTKKDVRPVSFTEITPQEAKRIMDTEADIRILDVRTEAEYNTGHVKGAICLPNEDIIEEPEELADKTQKILVYCRSGNRSKQAAAKLANMGYENVLEFGGILDWPYEELIE